MSNRAGGWAARQPLRVKLVAALIGLLVVGLTITGVAAWGTMRSYLTNQLDQQVTAQAPGIAFGLVQSAEQQAGGDLSQLSCPSTGDQGRLGDQPTNFYFHISNPTGTIACAPQDGSARGEPAWPSMSPDQASSQRGVPFTLGSQSSTQRWRTQAVVVRDRTGSEYVVYVAFSMDPLENTLHRLIFIEVIGGLVVVLLLGALGYGLVRRSLRPLVEVEEAAEDIAAGDLSRRVPELDPATEVGRLSRSFNTMVDRIESAFHAREQSEAAAKASEERMRRFVADASHELRTPLTSIRGFAELYRQGAVMDPNDISRVMRRIEDQATRMGLLVEDLLVLARLDQQRPLDLQPVDLLTIASEAVHDAQALEPDRTVTLDVSGSTPPPVVLGDETRLRQVVGNLMSNALTHTPRGTPVSVRVGVDGGFGELDVADQGPGLSADDAAHVFERFYRADSSRARASGGTGLGLSIASALVTAHDGALSVQTEPGHGATFTMRIPLALAPAGVDAEWAVDEAASPAPDSTH
jgi:two-component system OmpR family sensor kinase